jgi:hypothetical protein
MYLSERKRLESRARLEIEHQAVYKLPPRCDFIQKKRELEAKWVADFQKRMFESTFKLDLDMIKQSRLDLAI